MSPEKNTLARVMSTPTWPVPYYQRQHRYDPRPSEDDEILNLAAFNYPIHDIDVVWGKELLKSKGQGYVVEAVENHYDITDYKTKFTDSG